MNKLSNEEMVNITGGDNASYGEVLTNGGAAGITLAGGLAVTGTIAGAAVAAPVLIGVLAVVSIAAIIEGCWFSSKD